MFSRKFSVRQVKVFSAGMRTSMSSEPGWLAVMPNVNSSIRTRREREIFNFLLSEVLGKVGNKCR